MGKKRRSPEKPKSKREYKAEIRAMFAEMDEISARMDANRVEINRLKAETDVLREHTRAILRSMGAKL